MSVTVSKAKLFRRRGMNGKAPKTVVRGKVQTFDTPRKMRRREAALRRKEGQ